jgi:hypothetical protein
MLSASFDHLVGAREQRRRRAPIAADHMCVYEWVERDIEAFRAAVECLEDGHNILRAMNCEWDCIEAEVRAAAWTPSPAPHLECLHWL